MILIALKKKKKNIIIQDINIINIIKTKLKEGITKLKRNNKKIKINKKKEIERRKVTKVRKMNDR